MTDTTAPLKACFPYAGGKSRVADLVWARLGNVDNFVECFAGSLAVLLRRPAEHFAGGYRVETANDVNHFIVNFWRAVKADPERVAEFADSPVLEADLHARHKWLVRSEFAANWRKRMAEDPDHFDAKVAGWWVWGQCCWIGGAWCAHKVEQNVMPLLDSSQKGVHGSLDVGENPTDWVQVPRRDTVGGQDTDGISTGNGRPQLTDAFDIGRGVNAGGGLHAKRPDIGHGNAGWGVNASLTPHPAVGTCDARRAWLVDWMRRLSDRLRLVRTLYGHWDRACDSDSTMTRLGVTGVFLDPPYPANRGDNGKPSRDANLYASDKGADLDGLRDEVLAWCRKWGPNPDVRIAVCGYEGDGYAALVNEGWDEVSWVASGGYANQRRKGKKKSENAARERIWFSPHTIRPDVPQPNLFDFIPDEEPA